MERRPARVPVLTDHDVLAGTAPSGTLPESEEEAVLTEPGDVVVPVLGGGSVARVIDDTTAGAALGRSLVLLRPDHTVRLPLEEQRRFRALGEFERALRRASRLGEQLVRGMYDGLTDGTVAPG